VAIALDRQRGDQRFGRGLSVWYKPNHVAAARSRKSSGCRAGQRRKGPGWRSWVEDAARPESGETGAFTLEDERPAKGCTVGAGPAPAPEAVSRAADAARNR